MNNDTQHLDHPPVAMILTSQAPKTDLPEQINPSVATCSIAGKTLIEHILFELMSLGIKQTFVISNQEATQIQELTGNGERWGMTMGIEVMQYNIQKSLLLETFKSLSEPNGLLVIEADRLRNACVNEFIQRANHQDQTLLEAIDQQGNNLGLTLLKSNHTTGTTPWLLPLKKVRTNTLSSPEHLLNANIDTLKGKFAGIRPAAKRKQNPLLFQHHNAYVHKKCIINDAVMIGHHCHVERMATLRNTILSNQVYIEHGATIDNAVIMPNTFISKNTHIKNAIVNKNKIYQI